MCKVQGIARDNLAPSTRHQAPTDILWDKIVSIEYWGYEQVYDIEVEGTHNFIAGHWVERKAGKLGSWGAGRVEEGSRAKSGAENSSAQRRFISERKQREHQ